MLLRNVDVAMIFDVVGYRPSHEELRYGCVVVARRSRKPICPLGRNSKLIRFQVLPFHRDPVKSPKYLATYYLTTIMLAIT